MFRILETKVLSLGGNHSGAQPCEKFLELSRTATDSQNCIVLLILKVYNMVLHRTLNDSQSVLYCTVYTLICIFRIFPCVHKLILKQRRIV